MDDKKPVLLTLHEALRLDLIEAYVAVKHHHQRPGPAAYSLTRPGYESDSNLANTDHRIQCPDFKRDRSETDDY